MPVILSREESVGIVIIDNAQQLNAMNLRAFDKVDEILQVVGSDNSIRALIITAVGTRAFCVGADLTDLSGIGPEEAFTRAARRRGILQKLAELEVPSIAAMDGLVMGGGVEVALASTFRIATPRATFSFPEINLGLLPGAGGTQRLPRLIGLARARKMMLTAEPVDAPEALRIGLIDWMVEDPLKEAKATAAKVIRFSRAAVSGILASTQAAELPIADGLAREGEELAVLNSSPEALERITAFLDRRKQRSETRTLDGSQ